MVGKLAFDVEDAFRLFELLLDFITNGVETVGRSEGDLKVLAVLLTLEMHSEKKRFRSHL